MRSNKKKSKTEMIKGRWRLVRFLSFLLVFCILFSMANSVLKRKSLTSAWNTTTKISGLALEPRNSMDVMYFGSSHMYCSINPLVLFQQTGITSYTYAVQNQPLWSSYYYMKQALTYQSPRVVVLDAYPIALYNDKEYADESVTFPTTDEMPFSRNKIDLIRASVPEKERANHYIEFLKYHGRWKELKKEDFNLHYKDKTDYLKGYVLLPDINPQHFDLSVNAIHSQAKLSAKNLEYLDKVVALSKEKNFKLVLMITPYQMEKQQKEVFNALEIYAKNNSIDVLDYQNQIEDLGMDMSHDFYDKGHVNFYGAEKLTTAFGRYLTNQHFLMDKRESATYENWHWDYTAYQKAISLS